MEKRSIRVNLPEAYRYMGGVGAPDAELLPELTRASALIEEAAVPREISMLCELIRGDGLSLKGTTLRLTGKSVEALLHDAERCVIFCATLGGAVDMLIRKALLRDRAFATMLDACANSAIERLCDDIEASLTAEFQAQGLYLTDRFSPGYGDLPLEIQHDFCAALDTARKIGVHVGESMLMNPTKSVTALLGISNQPQQHRESGCRDCARAANCNFLRNGVTCYGQAV
jgi:5-methyltetrahydrofolate--homocysteine methyltransferase